MGTFESEYKKLNTQQRKAVDTIDGPLLVIAGPGTGKTQLLSARVANILQKTDTLPQNILCLTFTESGARAMRERLSGMIGPDAYDVQISTYHAFGSEIINQYPEFFETISLDRTDDIRFEQPIDGLTRLQAVTDIVDKLPYNNPLLSARYHVKDVVGTISELKRGLITPKKLKQIAKDNLDQAKKASPIVQETYGAVGTIPRKFDDAYALFSLLHERLRNEHGALIELAVQDLGEALEESTTISKTKPLTAWKNTWLQKTGNGTWRLGDDKVDKKLTALADVYSDYQSFLASSGMYDFDDMILAAVHALKNQPELRFNLQERYQHILLDEFQDTNAAQFELVCQIADHPVHEGRPNVMAVGDDDQAIYAFQGAEVSNMLKLKELFRDVPVINLTDNYRSHTDILHTAHNIANQIESRLHHSLEGVDKTLLAANPNLPDSAVIERHEFNAQASEYHWIAEQIKHLIDDGAEPSEIAVLSPKHRFLESLVPFLNEYNVPVSYEKRENILEAPLIRGLVMMCQLVQALANQDEKQASQLFPMVLSLEFWQVPTETIWRINWAMAKYTEERSWAEIAYEHEIVKPWVLFFQRLGSTANSTPLEHMLDELIGTTELQVGPDQEITSPLKDYYFSGESKQQKTLEYYEGISHLSVIRSKLREYQASEDNILHVADFLRFYDMYQSAEQPLINSHPIAQAQSAVQLMTAYKAKGLEFESVFLLSVHDDIWGKKARRGANKISLPQNLKTIRYYGSDEDELRRVLFVAITRAKHRLYLTSHSVSDSGKASEPVKYLIEGLSESGERISAALPTTNQVVRKNTVSGKDLYRDIELLWQQRHIKLQPPLLSLLKERLETYQMSPTHLNSFIDLEYSGPEAFLLGTLLRFPHAPGEDGEYGNAIHSTLEWVEKNVVAGKKPSIAECLKFFETDLKKRYISPERRDHFLEKGKNTLSLYIKARQDMLAKPTKSEVDFRKEGVLVGLAHLSGKIDRLEVDDKNKTVEIADYKTGKTYTRWESKASLLKYKQQLYFYKLLVEESHSYRGYTVTSARLEFIEPDDDGHIVEPLYINFDQNEEQELKQLISVVWTAIQTLQFPDTSEYPQSLAGIKQFLHSLVLSAQEEK